MEAAVALVMVVMGVMGCGKSTVAALLAHALGATFYEGDSFHPAANIAKMQAGIPLCDNDRWPWLQQLADVIQRHLASGQPAVLSCSALKPAYRQLLRTGRRQRSGAADLTECGSSSSMPCGSRHAADAAGPGGGTVPTVQAEDGTASGSSRVGFVLLNPPRHELEQRLLRRAAAGGHFTPGAALLDSQLAVLEYEEDELLLHVRGDPFPSAEQIVAAVFQRCGRAGLAG